MSEERRRCVKPCRKTAQPGRRTCGDRTCAARAGHRARPDHVQPQRHRCAREECEAWVERTAAHRTEADYRKVRYCATHRDAAKGKTGRRVAVRKDEEKRPCRRDGCRRRFSSPRADQLYCGQSCAVRARMPKRMPTKTCQCGCGERFARTPGQRTAAWEARRFLNAEHRQRAPSHLKGGGGGKRRETEKTRHPLANGEPGAARGGPRAPRTKKAKVGGNAKREEKPAALPVFPDAKRTPPRRFGAVPAVERAARQAPRPSFGLAKRRST